MQANHLPLADNNVTRIASFCDSTILINGIKSVGLFLAIHFFPVLAEGTLPTRVHISPNTNTVSNFKALNI